MGMETAESVGNAAFHASRLGDSTCRPSDEPDRYYLHRTGTPRRYTSTVQTRFAPASFTEYLARVQFTGTLDLASLGPSTFVFAFFGYIFNAKYASKN